MRRGLPRDWRLCVGAQLAFVSLTGGCAHTCGPTSGGVADCWGSNDHGQLGDATKINRFPPVQVTMP